MRIKTINLISIIIFSLLVIGIIPLSASFTYMGGSVDDKTAVVKPTLNEFNFNTFTKPIYPNEYEDDQESIDNLSIFDAISGGRKYEYDNEFHIAHVKDHEHSLANPFSSLNAALEELTWQRPYLISTDHIKVTINSQIVYKPLAQYVLGKNRDLDFKFAIVRENFYDTGNVRYYSIYTSSINIENIYQGYYVRRVYKTRIKCIIKESQRSYAYTIIDSVKGECPVDNLYYINENGKLNNKTKFFNFYGFEEYFS